MSIRQIAEQTQTDLDRLGLTHEFTLTETGPRCFTFTRNGVPVFGTAQIDVIALGLVCCTLMRLGTDDVESVDWLARQLGTGKPLTSIVATYQHEWRHRR